MEDRSGGIWVSSEFSGLSHLEILNKGTQLSPIPAARTVPDRSNTIRMLSKTETEISNMANRMGSLVRIRPRSDQDNTPRGFHPQCVQYERGLGR